MISQRSPNFDIISSLGTTDIAVNALFLGLAAIALSIRISSRKIQGARLCFNDYAALLAWPLAAGVLVCSILAATLGGTGKHITDVDPANVVPLFKTILASAFLWAAGNSFAKLSILHFYLTIFGSKATFRRTTFAVMALVLAYGIGVILVNFFLCRPFAKNWNRLLPGTCGSTDSTKVSYLAESIIVLIIDLAIIILPMPIVWQLQIAQKRKLALTIIFGLGTMVCVVTTIRLIIEAQVNLENFNYEINRIGIVTDLETLLSIIISCLPMFPPTFRKILRGTKNKSDSRKVLSSTVARLRFKGSKNSKTRQFDDLYPLTDLEGTRTENQISGPECKSLSDDQVLNAVALTYPPSAIKVNQGWEVRSDVVVTGGS